MTNPRTNPGPTTPAKPNPALPCETVVLNTTDGERGTILNGFAYENGQWTEYEVVTQYGIERWKRSDFVLMSECQTEE